MNIKIPVSWLREYLKTDVAAKTLATYFSLCGPSVERIEKFATDYVFDIEITANRFDAASILGLAREGHAILSSQNIKSTIIWPKGVNLNLDPDTAKPLPLDVVIKKGSLCPRFTAIVIDNVKVKASPAYIRARLEASGIRAINNIVDISNYLMLEMGQPMHTFDYDKVKGAKMVLRESEEGEKITTLDGATRTLPKGTIVISDAQRLIDLCGVMGAANSRVTLRTKRVVIFAQAYDPLKIRKTTQALVFRTEAAARFEKGVDLENIPRALSRAVYLAKQSANAKIASELIDIYKQKPQSLRIRLDFNKLNDYLGITLEPQQATKLLEKLGFRVKTSINSLEAKIPSWRSLDIEDDVDLIEEIARIYGYHNLPSKLPAGQTPKTRDGQLKNVINLKKTLKFLGLTEVISYSIISKELLSLTKTPPGQIVELANPLTGRWQYMRPNLLPSLLEVSSQNINFEQNLKLFEIAKTYIAQKNALPKQDLILAIVFSRADFYELKGVLENVFETLKRTTKWQNLSKEHPLFSQNQSAEIKVGEQTVATVGAINTNITNFFGINNPIAAAQINLTKVYASPAIETHLKAIPKYPPVIEDISAIFAKAAPIAEIVESVKKVSALVKDVQVIDIFEDEKIGENKKSVSIRLTYQKPSSTPIQQEVNAERAKIIAVLEKEFRAKIRM